MAEASNAIFAARIRWLSAGAHMFTFPAVDKSGIRYEAFTHEGMLGTERGVPPFRWNVFCIQDVSLKKSEHCKIRETMQTNTCRWFVARLARDRVDWATILTFIYLLLTELLKFKASSFKFIDRILEVRRHFCQDYSIVNCKRIYLFIIVICVRLVIFIYNCTHKNGFPKFE